MHLKMSCAKCRPYCCGLNVLVAGKQNECMLSPRGQWATLQTYCDIEMAFDIVSGALQCT